MNKDLWINGRFLLEDLPTGTQRSAFRFCQGVANHWPSYVYLAADPRATYARLFLKTAPRTVFHPCHLSSGWRAHLWEQFTFPRLSPNALQLHCMGTAPFVRPGRHQVMFVHDLNFIILDETFSLPFRLWYKLACAQAARRSRHIVCFTDYVKKTIVRLLGIAPDKVSVIPQGPGIDEALLAKHSNLGFSDPFFICVGSLQPHKNLKEVLQSWALWRDRPAELQLKIIGHPQKNFVGLNLSQDLLQQPGVSVTGYLSDEELVRHYQHALAFVYPSSEEGFGLPVVEAFHAGCPVITSNASCLPEVAGDAALLVHPDHPEEIIQALQRLYHDPDLRNRLVQAGRKRAKLFTWELATRKLTDLLIEIAST